MPIVKIELWPGRSQEVKNQVAKEIADTLIKNTGCSLQSITIQFQEIPPENWFINGQACGSVKDKK